MTWEILLLSFCMRSLRDLPARALTVPKNRLLSENGTHSRFCLSDCPSMTLLFTAQKHPKVMVPRELNFSGNSTLGKRGAKAQGPKEELSAGADCSVFWALDPQTSTCVSYYIISMTSQHRSRNRGESRRLSLVWSSWKQINFLLAVSMSCFETQRGYRQHECPLTTTAGWAWCVLSASANQNLLQRRASSCPALLNIFACPGKTWAFSCLPSGLLANECCTAS